MAIRQWGRRVGGKRDPAANHRDRELALARSLGGWDDLFQRSGGRDAIVALRLCRQDSHRSGVRHLNSMGPFRVLPASVVKGS